MITKQDLDNARPWQLFEPQEPTVKQDGLVWALFSSDDFNPSVNLDRKLAELGLELFNGELKEPERDDEETDGDFDDHDACIAHLQDGGHLLYVPDVNHEADAVHSLETFDDPKYGRFYAVVPL